jgi:transcriptional regulator with XRE-family HTH domain
MQNTANTPNQGSQTAFGDLISAAMAEKNLSIRGLAEIVGLTYEHVRRIVRGENLPSKVVIRAICNELGIDVNEAERLAVAAKITATYGAIPMEIAGKNPELEPIERVWNNLTKEQKRNAISMIQGWAASNRNPIG